MVFSKRTAGVDVGVVEDTVRVLRKAGVLSERGMQAEEMVDGKRGAQAP